MSLYPPPPPGWDTNQIQAPKLDGHEAERALREWAKTRGYDFTDHPDLAWYRRWAPFVYLFTPTRLGREIFARVDEGTVWMVEAFDDNAEPSETDNVYILSFLTSPRLAYRAAIRSRMQKEQIDELRAPYNPRKTPRSAGRWRWREREQFLRRTYGRGVRGVLGDAIFEAHCEIAAPSREEGLAALPLSLRHLLVQAGWRGIMEFRPGGLITTSYGPPIFDPASLDATLTFVRQVFDATTNHAYSIPPPSEPISQGYVAPGQHAPPSGHVQIPAAPPTGVPASQRAVPNTQPPPMAPPSSRDPKAR